MKKIIAKILIVALILNMQSTNFLSTIFADAIDAQINIASVSDTIYIDDEENDELDKIDGEYAEEPEEELSEEIVEEINTNDDINNEENERTENEIASISEIIDENDENDSINDEYNDEPEEEVDMQSMKVFKILWVLCFRM